MEEILIALGEVLLEVVLQGLAELPFDWALNRREKKTQARNARPHPALWIVLALIMGAVIGWWSGLLWPIPWPSSPIGHLTFIFISPLLVGVGSYFVNRQRVLRGGDWTRPWVHSGCATLFALTLAITRTLMLS